MKNYRGKNLPFYLEALQSFLHSWLPLHGDDLFIIAGAGEVFLVFDTYYLKVLKLFALPIIGCW